MERTIERIAEIGHGGEARVFLELRREFPFFDKKFKTKRDFITSFRVLHRGDKITKELLFKRSFMEFLRHLIAKKFDDFFLRMGYYKFPHIPRVLGFDTDGYYYEYVYGIEGYFPLYFDEDLKDFLPVKLIDEDEAKNEFHKAGIYIFQDIVEPTSNYVKNLIVEEPEISLMPEKISNLWKRIDFGVKSIKFDYEKIKKYLKERKKELIRVLNYKRYLLLNYAVLFLILNGNEKLFGKKKLEKLKKLIEPFLKSTLDHMGLIEEIPKEKKGFLTERRFKKTKIKKMKFENYKKDKEIYNKFLFDDKDFEFNLNIVSEIPSFDGIIKTKHVVPVAKVLIKNESSLKIFLIHFLIKKFEDFFITMEYYSFPHIPRPFGSYENALFYEFPFGKRLISESKFKSFQVDDLEIFYKCFLDIGIDLIEKVNFVESKDLNERVLKEFFVLQPQNTISSKISRMWIRGIFTPSDIEIDYNKVYEYLIKNREILKRNLTKGRYETMVLAIKSLLGDLDEKDFEKLKKGILSFRISSLRHYQPFEVYL